MQRFELRIKSVVENMLSTGTDDDDIDRKIAANFSGECKHFFLVVFCLGILFG